MHILSQIKSAAKRALEPYPKVLTFILSSYRFASSPWSEILYRRSRRMGYRLDKKVGLQGLALDPKKQSEYSFLVRQLCRELPNYQEYTALALQIRLLAYCAYLLRNESVNQLILTDVFERLQQNWSLDQRCSFLAYFITRGDFVRANALIFEELQNPEVAMMNSHFVKWAISFAITQKDLSLERRLLQAWRGGNTLHAYEIDQRKRHLASASPQQLRKSFEKIKVFVGFFGQLRDSNRTLPDLVGFIESDLKSEFGEDGFEVQYGLSAWDKEGNRELAEWHGMDQVTKKVPEHINELFEFYNCRLAADVIKSLPNVGRFLFEFSKRGSSPVTASAIQNLFKDRDVKCQIACERPVEQKIQSYQLNGSSIDPHLKNQFKMFSRLSGLKEIFAEFSSESEVPFDVCLILRPDLKIESGRLAPWIRRAVESEANLIITDQDRHAELIEGIGDRYLIGRPELLLPIIDCYSDMTKAFESEGPESILKQRIGAHEFLGSRIFTQGAYHEGVRALKFYIARNQVQNSELKDALLKDLATRNGSAEKNILKKHIDLL